MRSLQLASVATAALLGSAVAPAAHAQTTETGGEGVVSEVIVTAQKREERLQDVPQAVSVTSGDELRDRQIASMEQVAAIVPALKISTAYQGGSPFVTLRGIGPANQYNMNTNGPVGLYMDEVYQSFVPAPGVQFFDLQRVEVLKGPQGTLYGRNTTGGLMNFISTAPGLGGDRNGRVEVSYGNRDTITAQAATDLNLIEDKLGLRIALFHTESDGFMKNAGPTGPDTYGDQDSWQGRLTLKYQPTHDFTALLRLYSSKSLGTGSGPVMVGAGPGGTNALGYSRQGLDRREVVYDFTDSVTKTGFSGATLTLVWGRGPLTITSVTSGESNTARLSNDCDASPSPICYQDNHISGEQASQDLRAQYKGDRFNLTAGLFVGYDSLDYDAWTGFFGVANFRGQYTQERESYAGYLDGSFDLSDQLELTVGLRQTFDRVRLSDAQTAFLASPFGQPVSMTVPPSATYNPDLVLAPETHSPEALTGRVVLKYNLNTDTMFYASYSRGYRVGAFNGQAFFSPNELNYVGPEKVDQYELGFKAALLDRRLTLAAALFNTEIESQQVLTNITIPGVASFPGLAGLNGRSRGLEFDANAAITSDLRARVSVVLLDTKYDKGEVLNGVDIGGNRFSLAPKVAIQGGADWTLWRADEKTLTLSGNVSYSSQYYYDPENGSSGATDVIRNGQSSYVLADARLTYDFGAYAVAVWGRNLTNRYHRTFAANAAGSFGSDFTILGEPRSFGVTLSAEF